MSWEDRQRVAELKHRYCFTIDGGDYEEWVSLFTSDGRFVRPNGDVYEGPDELREFATEEFDDAFETTAHVVTNPLIEVDGDEATGKWYLVLFTQTEDGSVGWVHAQYDDQYRKVDGEWYVSEANVEHRIVPEEG